MNSRDRVMTAINHQEPDRVPLDLGGAACCMFTKKFYEKLLAHLGMKDRVMFIADIPTQVVIANNKVLERLGTDVRLGLAPFRNAKGDIQKKWEDDTSCYYRDSWGVEYRMPKDPGLYYDMTKHPMEDTEEEEDVNIHWPDFPRFSPALTRMHCKKIHKQGYFNAFSHYYSLGVYESGPRLYGFENWLAMLAEEPKRVTAYLTGMVDRKIEWWKTMFEMAGDDIDMVCELDDLGTQRAPWISPEMYKELIFPHHKRLYGAIKQMKPDVKIFHHSCGSIVPLIPYLIEAGVDVLNPVQTNASGMDPVFLKKEFGKDLTFWGGGIDTQYTLPHGTKQEIIDAVHRSIDILAPGGGFVFSPVHDIQPDVPVENFMLMRDTFMEYAKY